MPNTQPPTSDYETKLDTILLTFAKKIESMPRGKTYDWEDEKQAIMSLLNTELHKAREDELNQIPHELLHIPEVHEYKSKRLASLKEQLTDTNVGNPREPKEEK